MLGLSRVLEKPRFFFRRKRAFAQERRNREQRLVWFRRAARIVRITRNSFPILLTPFPILTPRSVHATTARSLNAKTFSRSTPNQCRSIRKLPAPSARKFTLR